MSEINMQQIFIFIKQIGKSQVTLNYSTHTVTKIWDGREKRHSETNVSVLGAILCARIFNLGNPLCLGEFVLNALDLSSVAKQKENSPFALFVMIFYFLMNNFISVRLIFLRRPLCRVSSSLKVVDSLEYIAKE